MSASSKTNVSISRDDEDVNKLRKGPWTVEEDDILIHYIACHGEGRWNKLANCSGLKRNGKSCRLRWLNYLKPDVKRGNLAPQEQLLILELHSKWGNRWSKIAQHLPGRTDNEIKNYWRTRVQKQAKHLNMDCNSTKFQEIIRCLWMPRLLQKIQASVPSATTNHQPLKQSPVQEIEAQRQVYSSSENNNQDGNSSSSELWISTDSSSSDGSMHIPQVPQLSEYPLSPFHMDDFNTLVNMDKFLDPMSGIDSVANIWIHDQVEDSSWNMDELWELQEWQN